MFKFKNEFENEFIFLLAYNTENGFRFNSLRTILLLFLQHRAYFRPSVVKNNKIKKGSIDSKVSLKTHRLFITWFVIYETFIFSWTSAFLHVSLHMHDKILLTTIKQWYTLHLYFQNVYFVWLFCQFKKFLQKFCCSLIFPASMD